MNNEVMATTASGIAWTIVMLTGGQFVPYFEGDVFHGAIFIANIQNLVISDT